MMMCSNIFHRSCKSQIVAFVASCLIDPEIFAEKSAKSLKDFAQIFEDDMSLASSQFLREVFDELEKQDGLEKVRENDDCR